MPLYCYRCLSCEMCFEKTHSMKDIIDSCILCGEKSVMRIPQMPSINVSKDFQAQKVGEKTKKFIEEAREDLKQQKEEMNEGREIK